MELGGRRRRLCLPLPGSSALETGCWGYVSLRLADGSCESGWPHSALSFQGLQPPEHLHRRPPCLEAMFLPRPPLKGTLQSRPKGTAWSGTLLHPGSSGQNTSPGTAPTLRHKVLGDPASVTMEPGFSWGREAGTKGV